MERSDGFGAKLERAPLIDRPFIGDFSGAALRRFRQDERANDARRTCRSYRIVPRERGSDESADSRMSRDLVVLRPRNLGNSCGVRAAHENECGDLVTIVPRNDDVLDERCAVSEQGEAQGSDVDPSPGG